MAGVEQMDNIISIHAPTRGATGLSAKQDFGHQFQSTLLQEERPFSRQLMRTQ